MPTGPKITIIFNCFAVALLASLFFDVDAGQRRKPVKPANPAIAALPAPAFVPSLAPSLAPSPALPIIHAAQTAPDVMQLIRQNAERDRMAEPWVTLSDGSVRLRD